MVSGVARTLTNHLESQFYVISIRRCYVGDRPDQWRTCSDRYFPIASESTTRPTKVAVPHTLANKKKGEAYQQAPPKPGGLNLEDVASARLWPVTYLYSSGPPNSTELSNFVDCNKESC